MVIKIICRFPSGDLKFATQNPRDESGNWPDKIINISSLSRNIGEDKSFEISGMSIRFNDTDRYFRRMMSGIHRFIAGKKVELYTITDQLLYAGVVEKWSFDEDMFEIFINDRLSGLGMLVPANITARDFPNLAEKSEGHSIPIVYGHLSAQAGAVKCRRVDENKFLLADHHCQALDGNTAYREDGSTISGISLDNNADGRAYIQCTSNESVIYVNVYGKTDAWANLMEDPIDVLTDILDNYSAMSYDTEAMNRAQAVAAQRGYKFAGVIQDQNTLQDVLKAFCFSFDCDFYMGRNNEINVTLLNWSALSPVKSFNQHRIIDFKIEELPDEIRNRVKYMYDYNSAMGEFQRMPIFSRQSSIDDWGEFYNKNEALDLRYVRDGDTAFDVIQRYVIQRKNPVRTAHVTLPLSEFSPVDIADIIEISHPSAIDENPRKYQVRRVDLDFINDVAELEAVDITTFTGGMFVLGSRDDAPLKPQWDDNDLYSRNYGYLADREDFYFGNDTDYGKVLY